jgi:anti-sigma factor RsiW
MRFFRFDDPVHQEVAELLPWLVNGTLAGMDRARVERHVSECIACRRELENLKALQNAIAQDDLDSSATQALAQLKARIVQDDPGRPRRRFHRSASRWRMPGLWLRGLLVAQFAALVFMAGAYLSRPSPQYFHTLAEPATAARGNVVVVFQAASTEREIREALLRVHAAIVGGPSIEGAYTLEVPDGEQRTVLEQLRQLPIVTFCEPAVLAPHAP